MMNEDTGNLRQKVVKCLCKAIDLEQENNNVAAYQKYLEGLSVVATALLQSSQGNYTGGSSLSRKDIKSLVGFAKQSVDRIGLLLDKQEQEASCIDEDDMIGNFDDIVGNSLETSNRNNKENSSASNGKNKKNSPTTQVVNLTPERCVEVPSVSLPSMPTIAKENQDASSDDSPMAQLWKENRLLIARYAIRLKNAPRKARPNLQLELQRRLIENTAIARQRQEVWEQRQKGLEDRCKEVAEKKFHIKDKLQNGTITENDFKKQRIYASCLKYEEENLPMKLVRQNLQLKPEDTPLLKQVLVKILSDRIHPIGRLVAQMQYAVQNKICPIIQRHQRLLCSDSVNNHNWNSLLSIDSGMKSMDSSDLSKEVSNHNINQQTGEKQAVDKSDFSGLWNSNNASTIVENSELFSQEDADAIKRHVNGIVEDIKEDLKLLEEILESLYISMKEEDGRLTAVGCFYQFYFQPLKQFLMPLFRLCTLKEEADLRNAMAMADDYSTEDINDSIQKSACTIFRELIELSSPCEKLDCLVAVIKLLCEEDKKCKSIGADDLLPRLSAVIVRSGLSHLAAEACYVESFMPEDRMLGECGYCVTVLQSVLNCIAAPEKK